MNFNKTIKIGKSVISEIDPAFIIAEAGVNHNGNLDLALDLVRKAKEAGAGCVKFQTFSAERVITKKAPKANYQLQVTDPNESQYEMLKKLELKGSHYGKIVKLCKKLNIEFLSTPYNKEDAEFLNDLGVNAFKIASGQLVEIPFLRYVAKFGKPVIISTGMADLAEVYYGLNAIYEAGNKEVILLQCTTNYPSLIEDANISAMQAMRRSLNVLVGYSDHVENNYACYSAVALGAKIIEKHFTLDRSMKGPDHRSSLDPSGFAELVNGIRNVERSLGDPVKTLTGPESKNITGMRRSIVAVRNLPKGTLIKEKDFDFKRPATGLSPKMLDEILGKETNKDLKKDEILTYASVNWEQYKEISINSKNIDLLSCFLENAGSSLKYFKYYQKRDFNVLRKHLYTSLLLDLDKNLPVCYGHLDKDGDKVWLGVAVIEEYIGKGLGNKMMDILIKKANDLKIKGIYLSVDNSNSTASRLYEKFGFRFQKAENDHKIYFMRPGNDNI